MSKQKKNYWVSKTFISRIKVLCEEGNLTEGQMLERLLAHYEGQDDVQQLASKLETKLLVTKKIVSGIEDDVLVAIKMLNSLATLQNIYTVVEEGQLLKEARDELRSEKNEQIIKAMNKKKF